MVSGGYLTKTSVLRLSFMKFLVHVEFGAYGLGRSADSSRIGI